MPRRNAFDGRRPRLASITSTCVEAVDRVAPLEPGLEAVRELSLPLIAQVREVAPTATYGLSLAGKLATVNELLRKQAQCQVVPTAKAKPQRQQKSIRPLPSCRQFQLWT